MFDSLRPWFVQMFRTLCQALPRAAGANAEVYFLGRYLVLKTAKPAVHDAIEYEAMVHHALASSATRTPPPLSLVGHYAYIPWLRTLVLPYCGHTLNNYTQPGGAKLDIPDIVHCARRIFAALEYLHMRGFVHRDIKPANMCYKRACGATVIDVGSTAREGATNVPASGTSPLYRPPEHVLLDDPPPTPQADLWAAGIVLFLLVEQTFPFFQAKGSLPVNLNTFRDRLCEYDVEISFRTTPHPLHGVIKTLLARNPTERFGTATEVLCALNKMSCE